MIKLIIALGKNNLIGNGNKMPWNSKEEFAHFRSTTIGHSLLFGKNTFDNLPGKLKDRTSYVFGPTITESADYSITSTEQLLELFNQFKNSQAILFIAGGKYIYENFFQYANELIVSYIKDNIPQEGNVYLNWDISNYQEKSKTEFNDFIEIVYIKKDN